MCYPIPSLHLSFPLRLAAVLLLVLAPAARAAEPLRVLLLDYNAPDEHDVLQSHLCVDRCSRERGCPDELVRDGVDYWSDQFIVYRPQYLGQNARFVIDIYRDRHIDLLSFSGHHASGFSGEHGRGRFDTELLGQDLAEAVGVTPFFTSPAMVLLQGCRTDVKSKFDGDPIAYVLHVIEDTVVREDQFERLLAAVQQIGGVQQAYRDLFPNACLLGYRGSQAPGGKLEIYAQVNSFLRGLAGRTGTLGPSPGGFAELNRRIERECPRGWPCNLCATNPEQYQPLANGLAAWLRQERQRIQTGRANSSTRAAALERTFEKTSYYHNSRWSCPVAAPGTQPVWPDPVDESPFGRLFVELLLLDIENLEPAQKTELRAELIHRLGNITFAEIDRLELHVWVRSPTHWPKLWEFIHGPVRDLSTFRQRDFFAFLANLTCRDCFVDLLTPQSPSLLRENAASQLRPELGPAPYLLALSDPEPRIRRSAAQRLQLAAGLDEAFKAALSHSDPEVRSVASEKLAVPDVPLTVPEPLDVPTPLAVTASDTVAGSAP